MEWDQFLEICRRLNAENVNYVLVGGFAVLLHGYERTTQDVDFIVDASSENVARIRTALQTLLPDAVDELRAEDVETHIVVRMMGEDMTIDLMKAIADYDFAKASQHIDWIEIEDVKIPLADVDTMMALKRGLRGKDHDDLMFLQGKKAYLTRKTTP